VTEYIHAVLGGIDPELVELADRPPKKRVSRRVRGALIAACLCVTLVAAACAAALSGVFVGEPGSFEMGGVTYEGTRIITKGVVPFSKDQFRAEFLTKAMERRTKNLEIGETHPLEYLSWKEAEEDMGVSLAESDFLQKHGVCGICSVYPFETVIRMRTVYLVENTNVGVWATIEVANEQNIGIADFIFASGETVRTDAIQMSDGSNALIVETEMTDGSQSYTGCFVRKGILYMINIENEKDSGGEKVKLLEKILESF
jgi:hypothetical protein